MGGQVLWSVQGTTQGDPLAMPFYALATVPLIDQLNSIQNASQVWYADDASNAGDLPSLRAWWDHICNVGSTFGYYANACKTWLVTKEQYLSKAQELFKDTDVSISSRGRPYLGALLGSEEFVQEFVQEFVFLKVCEWSDQLTKLADIATTQPHATYSAAVVPESECDQH